jgi:hypothetical protein
LFKKLFLSNSNKFNLGVFGPAYKMGIYFGQTDCAAVLIMELLFKHREWVFCLRAEIWEYFPIAMSLKPGAFETSFLPWAFDPR